MARDGSRERLLQRLAAAGVEVETLEDVGGSLVLALPRVFVPREEGEEEDDDDEDEDGWDEEEEWDEEEGEEQQQQQQDEDGGSCISLTAT